MSTLAAAFVVAVLGSPAVVGAPQSAMVSGVVRSSDTGEPIAYAEVQVVGDSIADWTDDDGQYELAGLEEGRWQLRVVHPGHDSLDVSVAIPGDRRIRLDITLDARPGPTVDALADFEPFQVAYTLPALANSEEVASIIEARYPPDLASRGVGGEAVLRLWLDERGQVVRRLLSSSSGAAELDSMAMDVAELMRFRPAKNRDQAVRVIVRIPVFFTVPDSLITDPR